MILLCENTNFLLLTKKKYFFLNKKYFNFIIHQKTILMKKTILIFAMVFVFGHCFAQSTIMEVKNTTFCPITYTLFLHAMGFPCATKQTPNIVLPAMSSITYHDPTSLPLLGGGFGGYSDIYDGAKVSDGSGTSCSIPLSYPGNCLGYPVTGYLSCVCSGTTWIWFVPGPNSYEIHP